MKESNHLQAQFSDLVERVEKKQAELTRLETALQALIGQMVDAVDAQQRQELIEQRAAMVAEREALADELRELKRRRDVASLAIYEFELERLEGEYNIFRGANLEKSRALDVLLAEQRAFLNGGRAKMPKEQGDQRSIELSTEVARLKAEVQIVNRDAWHAKEARDRALQALQEMRTGLEA